MCVCTCIDIHMIIISKVYIIMSKNILVQIHLKYFSLQTSKGCLNRDSVDGIFWLENSAS